DGGGGDRGGDSDNAEAHEGSFSQTPGSGGRRPVREAPETGPTGRPEPSEGLGGVAAAPGPGTPAGAEQPRRGRGGTIFRRTPAPSAGCPGRPEGLPRGPRPAPR